MSTSTPQFVYLADYQPAPYEIDQVHLIFELDTLCTRVKAQLKIKRRPDTPIDEPLILNGVQLDLQSVKLNANLLAPSQYELTPESLIIKTPLESEFTLETEVIISPQSNTALEGLYASKSMLCTQCEAEGFRHITYFLDRPDVMATYQTTLIGDRQRYPAMLSNGNLIEQGEYDEYRHYVVWEDPFLKPSYLFAVVAGQLLKHEDEFITFNQKKVTLQLWVERENRHKTDYAIEALKRAMRWDEKTYHREYDLDLFMFVAVNDFNMGAMENKGLNIFNSAAILANPETTTDSAYQRIESVIAHEYFHNWSGNRVTCRDWFQLSLKEGFTVFREQSFAAFANQSAAKRIEDVNLLRTVQFAEDSGPTAHPVRPAAYAEIGNFYTVTIYEKGAEIVRMLYHLLGAEKFIQATDIYFSRYDGQAVTIEDFVSVMAEVSQQDLSQFLYWYTQAGTPIVKAHSQYDPVQKTLTLELTQQLSNTPGQDASDKNMQVIPIRMGLIDDSGKALPLKLKTEKLADESVLILNSAQQSWIFTELDKKPIVSLLRGFSAPVKLQYPYTQAELLTLIKFDVDIFNRWEICQQFILQAIEVQLQNYAAQKPITLSLELEDLYRYLITHEHPDYSVLALMLKLPSEAYIAQQQDQIEIDGIHHVRQMIMKQLGKNLYSHWLALYQKSCRVEDYAPTPAQMAQRAIKNCALQFLAITDREESSDLIWNQFVSSDNMTDQYAALLLLVQSPQVEMRNQAIKAFYDQWIEDPLVMDQWFSAQAQWLEPEVLDLIKTLLNHPQFSLTNPNKVRALIGTFSQVNRVNFHRLDGKGYELLATIIMQLDKLNPEIAARLLTPLLHFRQLDSLRKQLICEQLNQLKLNCQSTHVLELVSKALS